MTWSFSLSCSSSADSKANPIDIFAIGFEEMVELNAGNIVSARYVCKIPASDNISVFVIHRRDIAQVFSDLFSAYTHTHTPIHPSIFVFIV